MTKVSASIVSYNGCDEVVNTALSVLLHTSEVELELFLIDNASPDGTGDILKRTHLPSNAHVLTLSENIGFGSGHNKILDKINSKYHAVINPDITLEEDTIYKICSWLDEHEDVVIATPRLLYPDKREQHTAKRKPTFLSLLSRQIPIKALKNIEKHYLMLDADLSLPCEVEFCSGCFFIIRTEYFKQMGGFDEKYFLYVEDADITQKALKYGKAYYLPQTYVLHAWHRDANKKLKNFLLQIGSMLRYWRKWGFRFK